MLWLALAVALETPPAPSRAGTVALLVERIAEQDARQAVVHALRDPDPRVRAAAARVTFVGGFLAAPQLLEALRVETDSDAAEEELRALLPLAEPALHGELLRQAARLGRSTSTITALARARGPEILDLLSAGAVDEDALSAAADALRQEPMEVRGRVAEMALASGDVAAWRTVLEETVPPALLAKGLASSSDGLRAATYEHLLGMPTLPDAPALREALQARSETSDPARLAYLRDLLRRKSDPDHHVDPGWPERLREVRAGLMWSAFADLMTAAERKALMMAEVRPRGAVAEVKPDPQLPRIRTIGDLPPGLLADLMSATGCQPKGRTIAIAEIGYDRDARPLRVRIASQGGTPACQRAMKAALSLDVSARVDPDPTTEVVLVRLDEGIPSCHESQATAKARPSRVGGRIQEPRKTKTVPPIYPSIAKGKLIQGLVVVQALIEPTGCVAGVELLHGANIHLDMEAVATVAAWRYTPTLIDGVAVPVLMTVTVNFKLN